MSFSNQVKKELCALQQKECCRKAQAYGMLLFGKSFSLLAMGIQTENYAAAKLISECLAEETGCMIQVSHPSGDGRKFYTISVDSREERERILEHFGYTGLEPNIRVNMANMEQDCCLSAFLRGAFLTCGTVMDPQKGYRLEFLIPHKNLSDSFLEFFSQLGDFSIRPKLIRRRGSYVLYLKSSEEIMDLLTYMGAVRSSMEYMQVKMIKEVRNDVNRRTNFDTANIDKIVSASAQQAEAIRLLAERNRLKELPEELQEMAALRLKYPEMSLRELGEQLDPPITRSGVNHRLRKLTELAEKLED